MIPPAGKHQAAVARACRRERKNVTIVVPQGNRTCLWLRVQEGMFARPRAQVGLDCEFHILAVPAINPQEVVGNQRALIGIQ